MLYSKHSVIISYLLHALEHVYYLGFSTEAEPIGFFFFFKELTQTIMEADKSQGVQGESARQRSRRPDVSV